MLTHNKPTRYSIDNKLKERVEMSRKIELVVDLSDADGNVFALCGKVTKTLKRGGYYEYAKALPNELNNCKNYNEALSLFNSYVDIVV